MSVLGNIKNVLFPKWDKEGMANLTDVRYLVPPDFEDREEVNRLLYEYIFSRSDIWTGSVYTIDGEITVPQEVGLNITNMIYHLVIQVQELNVADDLGVYTYSLESEGEIDGDESYVIVDGKKYDYADFYVHVYNEYGENVADKFEFNVIYDIIGQYIADRANVTTMAQVYYPMTEKWGYSKKVNEEVSRIKGMMNL
jgi:hypothetical protein